MSHCLKNLSIEPSSHIYCTYCVSIYKVYVNNPFINRLKKSTQVRFHLVKMRFPRGRYKHLFRYFWSERQETIGNYDKVFLYPNKEKPHLIQGR